MLQQDDPISKYYQMISKIENKLNTHLENLYKLIKAAENAINQNREATGGGTVTGRDGGTTGRDCYRTLEEYQSKVDKFITNANVKIQGIYDELEEYLDQNGDLQTRYTILTQSRKQLISSITTLKQQLHTNRSQIQAHKKSQSKISLLTSQLTLQQKTITKLQQAYNNALRLQTDMQAKIRELQHQENQMNARYDWQVQREIVGEGFLRNLEKYGKLGEQKLGIFGGLEQKVRDWNREYLDKFTQLSALKTKIKGIDQIYQELEVNVHEQELIIKEILIKEGLSSSYLLQVTKKENQLNQDSDEQTPKNIQKSIEKFRRKIGLVNTTSYSKSAKIYTQPVPNTSEMKPVNAPSQNVKNVMRLTTKIPQTQIRQRVKRSSLQNESLLQNQKRIKKSSIKQVGNMSAFLPPIQTQQDLSYFPISHNIATPTKNIQTKKSKGSYSHQITHTKMFRHFNSHIPSENQDMFPLDNHFVRIRTKGGYIYKNLEDGTNINTQREEESDQGHKSEIVNLYEKLSNKLAANKSISDEAKKYNLESEGKQQSQIEKMPQIYAKLARSRKKGKQSNKKILQSRQSDPDNEQGKLKLSLGDVKNSSEESVKKDDSEGEVRRRLNTIHEGEEHVQDSKANNK